jgi:hypothetical protein
VRGLVGPLHPQDRSFRRRPPPLPTRFERARDCGPNLVVVYEPGSAADLCLLWHLRSVHGLRAGFPLGVPVTADVAAALANWWGEYAMLSWGLRTTTGHLVSASVDLNQLEQLAATAGAQWSAVPWQEVLQPNRGCGIGSMEVALFDSGQATLSAVHPAETAALGPDVIAEVGQALELMATPSGQMLPPSSTLAREGYFAKYREGAIVPRGDYRTAATMVWPTGLSVLDAVVRDLGFRATPSAPGRLAETLLRRTATLGGLAPLLHPNMQAMLARLGSRHGMNWFKDHLRQALNVDVEGNEAVGERLAAMEEPLRQLAGRPSEEEQTDVTFDDVRAQLNNDRTAAHAWLNWADQAGLILRGAQVQCTHCTRRSWRPLNELAPPVVCRGCGEAIERPYGYDQVKFRFRATELLLGLVKDDAVVHALALRFLSELFRPSFNTVGPILGGYPGVTIRRPGVSDPLGEADVLFVMIDGRVGVGECKVRANGLVEEEVAKLARLSDALSASWTFTATLDRAAACGPLWRVNPNGERVPHFALTAEHLYDSLPIAALGTDPLSWRTSYNSLGAHGAISDEQHQSEFVATVRDMDEWRLKRQLPAWRARD